MERRRPGAVRDAILVALKEAKGPQTVAEIRATVESSLGSPVAPSSIRSYLGINTPSLFTRVGRGQYVLSVSGT